MIALHALQGFAPGSAALAAAPPLSVARTLEGSSPTLEIRILRVRFLRRR